jgi:hypothetical protein
MKNYVLYNADGVIVQHGTCPDEMILSNWGDGLYVMEGSANHEQHYISNGEICAYTESELLAKNNLPQGWAWQMPERIAVDLRALDDAKVQAWQRIKKARLAAEAANFACDGALYQPDKERIGGAVQMALMAQLAGQPFSIDWTLADNSVKTLDAAGMIAVGTALGMKVSAAFDTARALRDQIANAATIAEVDAIGWPA